MVKDKLKIELLERLVKNLYHAREIKYRLNKPEFKEIPNRIEMIGINTLDDIPKLHDCCDMGLDQDITLDTEYNKDHKQYFAIINVEIWFNENPYETNRKLKEELKTLKSINTNIIKEE